MKCCFKGCEIVGAPADGFDFFACEGCLEKMQLLIAQGYGFKAGLEAAAKHEPRHAPAEWLRRSFYICSCGQWDSRSGQSWSDHIKAVASKSNKEVIPAL